jgi:capsular polysaccharide biosynthesis protein
MPSIQVETVTALLDRVAVTMAHGDEATALRMLQKDYPMPKGWVPAIERNAPQTWSRTASRRIVLQRNGTLYAGSRDWFTKTNDGLHISDQTNANPAGGQYVLRHTATHTALVAPRPSATIDQPAALIGSNANYCHWLLDFMPRLPLVQDVDNDVKMILGAQLAPYEQAAIQGLGITPDRLFHMNNHHVSRFKRLHIPDLGTVDRVPHPETVDWLRSTFLTRRGTKRRIWISRKAASIRRVVNEDQILEVLAPLGFQTVELEGLSIYEQAELFAGAEIIAGPHGAAFANAVFAPPGARLIEVVPGGYRPVFFKAIAQACDLGYACHAAPATPTGTQRSHQHPRNWDMTITDPAALLALINH